MMIFYDEPCRRKNSVISHFWYLTKVDKQSTLRQCFTRIYFSQSKDSDIDVSTKSVNLLRCSFLLLYLCEPAYFNTISYADVCTFCNLPRETLLNLICSCTVAVPS